MAGIDRFNWNDLVLTYGDNVNTIPGHAIYTDGTQADNHDTLAYVLDPLFREHQAVNINWPHRMAETGAQELAALLDMYRRGLISQKKILSTFNFDNLEVIREFVAQSAREAEASIAAATRDGDKERHTWWCGFVEALNEVAAKMEEMEETLERTTEEAAREANGEADDPVEEVDDWINQEDANGPF